MNLEEMNLTELKAIAFDLIVQLKQTEEALKMVQDRMQILSKPNEN